MSSVILRMAAGILKPLFLIVSVWLLLRGHNHPGGGFIGGLIAGSAFMFRPLAYDTDKLERNEYGVAIIMLVLGISLVMISALTGVITEGTILKGLWIQPELPLPGGKIKFGTPLLFDVGIYFTVIGFIYLIFITMMEEWQWT
jgi:multicomponent Na+:H+ antiporter subunit B